MIRIYVIYFICIFEIFQLLQNCSARPTDKNENVILDDSVHNNNSNNLNNKDNDNSMNLSKRSIVFATSKNCDKVEHTGKCANRTKSKKYGETPEMNIELLVPTSSTPVEADLTKNVDHLTDVLPIISDNFQEFLQS